MTGEVEPYPALTHADKQRVQYTIDLLNLNSLRLVHRRRDLITETVKIITQLANDGGEEALYYFADMDLGLRGDCLLPFYSLRLQQFQKLAPHILKRITEVS